MVAVLSLAALAGGCGESRDPNLPPLVPVSGDVTLDGKPLPSATVFFLPQGETLGTGSTGVTDANGHYELDTLHNGHGAPVGEYKVTISRIVQPDGTEFPKDQVIDIMGTPHKQLVPEKYSEMEQSVLTKTIPAGGGEIDFDLTTTDESTSTDD